jgi:hypothetical protein
MVKEPLVTPDAAFGEAILERLDVQKSNLPITVALWLKEDDKWTLVLGTPEYDRLGAKNAYLRLIGILSDDGPIAMSTLPIRLEGHKDPFIRDLRRLFGKTAAVEGMHLGGQTLGGKWIEDAYVYRIK